MFFWQNEPVELSGGSDGLNCNDLVVLQGLGSVISSVAKRR
jgi:hypothetical protein